MGHIRSTVILSILLIEVLEPDFHGLPPVELHDLSSHDDHGNSEQTNLADELPEVVENLHAQMMDHVHRRLNKTGLLDPLETQKITLGKRVTEKGK
jgi:hypothetical protein